MTNIIHTLPERQRIIVENAAADVFTARLENYYQYVGDVLRPMREIHDTDVRFAVSCALHRYGARRA